MSAVAIAPDLGERQLDTVYNQNWVRETYWPETSCLDEPAEDWSWDQDITFPARRRF